MSRKRFRRVCHVAPHSLENEKSPPFMQRRRVGNSRRPPTNRERKFSRALRDLFWYIPPDPFREGKPLRKLPYFVSRDKSGESTGGMCMYLVCMKIPRKYALVNLCGCPSRLAPQIIADGLDPSRFNALADRPRYRKISLLLPSPSRARSSRPSGVLPSGRPQKWSYIARTRRWGSLRGVAFPPSETDASRTSARPFIPLNATFTCIMSPP